MQYVIFKSRYKCDIVFITRSRGGAEAEGNKNDHASTRDITGFYPSVQYVINFMYSSRQRPQLYYIFVK